MNWTLIGWTFFALQMVACQAAFVFGYILVLRRQKAGGQ